MVIRNIIKIDEELCDGCGQCIPNCAEEALQIVDGKAKLVKDIYCDGLGACLGHCPNGALTITRKEANPFDEEAVHTHILKNANVTNDSTSKSNTDSKSLTVAESDKDSALTHWPIQLNLVSPNASFFNNSDLLVVADCVPIAYPKFHITLLPGKSVVIGCPKFDDAKSYVRKLGEILKRNNVRNIVVAYMEVPCCSGLNWIINKAVEASGKNIPIIQHVISVKGELR